MMPGELPQPMIVGGTPVVLLVLIVNMTLWFHYNQWMVGWSLLWWFISREDWVVTAAHCVQGEFTKVYRCSDWIT